MKGWVAIIPASGKRGRFYRTTKPLSLKRAQAIVGGYVEPVPGWDYVTHEGKRWHALALCNEDGKGGRGKADPGQPVNKLATKLWWSACGGPHGDYLVGTVLVMFGPVHFQDGGW